MDGGRGRAGERARAPHVVARRVVAVVAALGAPACFVGPAPIFDEACVGGYAGPFPCSNVDLNAFLPSESIGGGDLSSLWGWTHEGSGREFAIVGRETGTAFVEVTNPARPLYVGDLPAHGLRVFHDSAWRELTVMFDHAFIVSEAPDHALRVFDLTRLLDVDAPPASFESDAVYTGGPGDDAPPPADLVQLHHPEQRAQVEGQGGALSTAHTIFANASTGVVTLHGSNTCNGGPHFVDAREPKQPRFLGCVAEHGYTHDGLCVVYDGPDVEHVGREICVLSNGEIFDPGAYHASRLVIVDASDKSAPRTLSVSEYPDAAYAHQGALTEDHRFLLMDDEFDEVVHSRNTSTLVWDLADLDAPVFVGRHEHPGRAIDHNQHVRDGRVFQANYRAGLRVLDLDGIATATLDEVAYFDVYPDDDEPYFDGAWNTFPFFPSGTVIVSGIESGLFVLEPELDE